MSKIINVKGNHDFRDSFVIQSATPIVDTTESSSVTSGALIVSGGVGIGKNLNIGGSLSVKERLSTTYNLKETVIKTTANINAVGLVSQDGTTILLPNSGFYNRKTKKDPFILTTPSIYSTGAIYTDIYTYNNTRWATSNATSGNSGARIYNLTNGTSTGYQYFPKGFGNFTDEYCIFSGGGAGTVVLYVSKLNLETNIWPQSILTINVGTSSNRAGGISLSAHAERILVHEITGPKIFVKQVGETWSITESLVPNPGQEVDSLSINRSGDLIFIGDTSNKVYIYERSGTTWTLVSHNDDGLVGYESSYNPNWLQTSGFGGNGVLSKNGLFLYLFDFSGKIYIYRKNTSFNWTLVKTLNDLPITSLKDYRVTNDGLGLLIITSEQDPGTSEYLSYYYDLENNLEFENSIEVGEYRFRDGLVIKSSLDSDDYLITLPKTNASGSLVNDGSGVCEWKDPYNQSLNTSDNAVFDCISVSPNAGQPSYSPELLLSFRKLNESYVGKCVLIRREPDLTVDYLLFEDIDSNTSMNGVTTYNSTGGTSGKGRITGTLSVSNTFIVDGITITSVENGTSILLTGQIDDSSNGVWVTTVSGTSLTLDRSTLYDRDEQVFENGSIWVLSGTTYALSGATLVTEDPIVIGGSGGTGLNYITRDFEIYKDIGFDSSGSIDMSELVNHLGNNLGYIETWYDQSSNGNDFTQTDYGLQPLLIMNGLGNKPTLSFDGIGTCMDGGNVLNIGFSDGWFVNAVTDVSVSNWTIAYPPLQFPIISKAAQSGSNRWGLDNWDRSDVIINMYTTYEDTVSTPTVYRKTNTPAQPTIVSLLIDRTPSVKEYNAYVNNFGEPGYWTAPSTKTSITNDNTYDFTSTENVFLGTSSGGTGFFHGVMSEVIIYSDVLTTVERAGIETDQSTYYNIGINRMPQINFKSSDTISNDYTLTLPDTQSNVDQVMVNDGSGNLIWGGDIRFNSGKGIVLDEGNTDSVQGVSTLVAGSIVVNTTAITSSSRVFLTVQTVGGTQGFLSVGSIAANTSFTISSSSGVDTSTVAWLITGFV